MGLEELDGCRGGRGTKLLTPWVGTYKPTLVLISRRGGPVTLRGHCPWAGTAVFFSSFLPHSNLLQYLPAESKRSPPSKGIKKRAFGDSQSRQYKRRIGGNTKRITSKILFSISCHILMPNCDCLIDSLLMKFHFFAPFSLVAAIRVVITCYKGS